MDEKINRLLTRGVDEIIVKETLRKKLNSKKKLVVKLGIDPTGPELHLGHAVVLRKLREFQDLGHNAVLVIGDFTARIGDPSGKSKARKVLTTDDIKKNMQTFKDQASKILDLNSITFKYNSQWLGRMGLKEILELASKATFAQIFERKDFRARMEEGNDIAYLETLYPLMQGYDSVHLKADIELGGTDQKFNLLMGRQMQKRYDQEEQDLVIMRLLPGTDGAKMSKSAGNYISLMAFPSDMYGKLMAVEDDLLAEYFELCTDISMQEIGDIKSKVTKGGKEVFNLKKKLAREIVQIYHPGTAALDAEKEFESKHGEDYTGADIEETIPAGKYHSTQFPIISNATTSTVHARRLVKEGAVERNNEKLDLEQIEVVPGDVIRVGKKRFLKVIAK